MTRREMVSFMVVVLAVWISACSSSSNPVNFDGTWTGAASGEVFRFAIDTDANSSGENVTSACLANLTLVSQDMDTLVMQVDLVSGACVDNALAVFTWVDNGEIYYELFAPGADYDNDIPLLEGPLNRLP